MCGRFALDAPAAKVKKQLQVEDLDELPLRYNIPPGQEVLFLCHLEDEPANTALWLRWGLIPFWAKDKKIGNSLANARSETVAEKPAFRQSFKAKRGVMVMSGFFEWQNGAKKQPYYFKQKQGELLAIAALWDTWQSEDGEIINSCCLLTTSANNLMLPVHNRMPVILDRVSMKAWMDNAHYDKPALLSLLKPYAGADLICYPVTNKMNSAKFSAQEAIEPLR